jgi:hypothetical protein
VRYLGGDASLVDDVMHNRAARSIPGHAAAFFAAGCSEAPRQPIDAYEYLMLHGHSESEAKCLAVEFGKALKLAAGKLSVGGITKRTQQFGANCNDVQVYDRRAHRGFLAAVYAVFQTRELFKQVVDGDLREMVAKALEGTRGMPPKDSVLNAESSQGSAASQCAPLQPSEGGSLICLGWRPPAEHPSGKAAHQRPRMPRCPLRILHED